MFLLPEKVSTARANMLADSAMLESAGALGAPLLRFYGWLGDCFTCGISQNVADARRFLPEGAFLEKRPSGGGLVDHRKDLTYALAIPRGRPLCEMRAADSYREVHAAIVRALADFGISASLCARDFPKPKGALAVCFSMPAVHDVILQNGKKFAGAAQKRTRDGILFQGSMLRGELMESAEAAFKAQIAKNFADILGEACEKSDFPDAVKSALLF